MGRARRHPPGGHSCAVRATEIEEGDQFVGSDGRLFWTALRRADPPYGGYVRVLVVLPDGRSDERWLPVHRDLPIRRPGVSA